MSENQQNAGITKTKAIRIKLEGEKYLAFHNLTGRVVFKGKMNEKQTDAALIHLALSLLMDKIDKRLKSGEKFILAETI